MPLCWNRASTRVVLPWSTCAMIAMFRICGFATRVGRRLGILIVYSTGASGPSAAEPPCEPAIEAEAVGGRVDVLEVAQIGARRQSLVQRHLDASAKIDAELGRIRTCVPNREARAGQREAGGGIGREAVLERKMIERVA